MGTSVAPPYVSENLGAERVDASVLVPVLNEEVFLVKAVPAMLAQRFDGTIEFLFMDGRSTDGSREILKEIGREDPRIRVLDNPARQTAKALNIGLKAARGEYVVRMDAHAYYPRDYIAKGVERLRQGDVDWVCGPQVAVGEGTWSRRVALALNQAFGTGASRRFGRREDSSEELELDTGVFTGIWRRSTLEEYGGWDEDWPVNQDSELAARVLDGGGRILSVPALAADYVPRNSPRALARQYFRYGFYRAKTSQRHPSSLRRSQLFPPGLVVIAVVAFLLPRPVAALGRVALVAYLCALGAVSTRAAAKAETALDAAVLPAVFATMHLAWGSGFLVGCARFGLGPRALARRLIGRRATARADGPIGAEAAPPTGLSATRRRPIVAE